MAKILKDYDETKISMRTKLPKDKEEIFDITRESNVATKALDLVLGDRENDYDHPVRDFIGTCMLWTSYLRRKLIPGEVITPLDFPMMMVMVKLSRESHKHKPDNGIDIVGYTITQERVQKYLDYHNLKADDLMKIYKQVQQDIMEEQ